MYSCQPSGLLLVSLLDTLGREGKAALCCWSGHIEGPKYKAMVAFGSFLCNEYAIDTISTEVTIALAMGILGKRFNYKRRC